MIRSFSNLLSPPVIGMIVPLIFAVFSPIGWGSMNMDTSIITGLIFIGILPVLPWIIEVKKKKVDFDVSKRKKRTVLYTCAVISYITASVIFWLTCNKIMLAISLSYAFVTILIEIINLKWKISAHAAGIAGPTTAITYVFGTFFLPLYLLTIFVFWLRLKLKAHTPAQLFAGAGLAVLTTYLVYATIW